MTAVEQDASHLEVELTDGVATLTMNRPHVLNALSGQMVREMHAAFEGFHENPAVRAVVLRGAGRAFCAGGDVKSMNTGQIRTAATVRDGLLYSAPRLLRSITELEKPVVAVVNGPAYGAGLGIALACDFILAGPAAAFCGSFVRRGLVPDYGASYLLTQAVGVRVAKNLLMRALVVPAERAYELGLITELFGAENFEEQVAEFVGALRSGPTLALGLTKRLVATAAGSDLASAVEREAMSQGQSVQSDDHREGVAAFLERRQPRFTGT